MTAINVRADARQLPLPDDSVDLIVTSPPYFALRSYQDGGEHYDGQIGSETTPTEYLDAMVDCIREWTRVLKPCGSIFINMGDKYSTGNSGQSGLVELGKKWAGGGHTDARAKQPSGRVPGMQPKSLLGVPWRLALRCIDDLGLILRAEIIWAKPNGLPESVTDRARRSHEQIFHLTLQPRYYSAVDEAREQYEPTTISREKYVRRAHTPNGYTDVTRGVLRENREGQTHNPLGKLPGSVWTIPSSPLRLPEWLGVDHFAAYPADLIRPIILGWSPPGICVECGEGRRPTTDRAYDKRAVHTKDIRNKTVARLQPGNGNPGSVAGDFMGALRVTITGYTCACPTPTAPTRPAIVLDPFGGTGTTALVASTHGRIGISVDLSHDYSRAAAWRTHDPGERARALKVEKPPPVHDGQLDLLGDLT